MTTPRTPSTPKRFRIGPFIGQDKESDRQRVAFTLRCVESSEPATDADGGPTRSSWPFVSGVLAESPFQAAIAFGSRP